jgi:branched-chain amino acid transport system permease protein
MAPPAGGLLRRRVVWAYAALVVLGVVAPFLVYPVFAMNVLCLALFASAFNLLLGYGGLLSFGHAAFLGSARRPRDPPLRHLLRDDHDGVRAARLLPRGPAAVDRRRGRAPGDPAREAARGRRPRRQLLFGFWLIHRTIDSPFGHVLRAIRENEPRALSLGYDVDRYKLLAFVLSATLSGLAGSLKALTLQFASLSDVHWHLSGTVVLMTLLGGLGTVMGPSVGALLVVALENYLNQLGSWVTVLTGAVFVVCVLAFRRGIVGEARALWNKSFNA